MIEYQGEKFQSFLERKGISVISAAKRLGVSRQTVYQYFKSSALERETVNNILTSFDASEHDIFGENSDDPLTTHNKIENFSRAESVLIPMYNFPSAASDIEMYNNPNEVKVIGHLNLPGARKNSFALPVYGHSMYPTLENGAWCVLRELSDPHDIVWGEIYYIEWGDYRMFKRLLKAESEDHVVLWSDNQLDKIDDQPKYSPVTIKKEKIRRLCLLTDIVKKPNY